MTVVIRHVRPDEAWDAYQWHRTFADSDDHIFPRTWDTYRTFAENYQLVVAVEDGEFLGLCYYAQDEETHEWEIGGLMVAPGQQGRRIGSTLMCVALGNLLIDIDPLAIGEGVISHVIKGNSAPRGIIVRLLKFDHRREVRIPGHVLPGLKTEDDGMVHGDEFELSIPESLIALALWSAGWIGQLPDGSDAHIDLREGLTLADWSDAFMEMANTYGQ